MCAIAIASSFPETCMTPFQIDIGAPGAAASGAAQ